MYNRSMKFKKSQQMIAFWNIFAYGGNRPTNVTPARWAAICKFFENNL